MGKTRQMMRQKDCVEVVNDGRKNKYLRFTVLWTSAVGKPFTGNYFFHPPSLR